MFKVEIENNFGGQMMYDMGALKRGIKKRARRWEDQNLSSWDENHKSAYPNISANSKHEEYFQKKYKKLCQKTPKLNGCKPLKKIKSWW